MTIENLLCFEIYHHVALSTPLTPMYLKVTSCYFGGTSVKKRMVYYLLAQKESVLAINQTNKQTAYLSIEAAIFIPGSSMDILPWVAINHCFSAQSCTIQPYWERRFSSTQLCPFLKRILLCLPTKLVTSSTFMKTQRPLYSFKNLF